MPCLTAEQKAFVDHVVAGVPFLSYNAETGHFDVADDMTDPSWDELQLLFRAVGRLREHTQGPFLLPPVRLDEIRTGFPDRCLEHHAHQTLDLAVADAQTCWLEKGLFNRCLGRLELGRELGEEERTRILARLGSRHASWVDTNLRRALEARPALADRLAVDDAGWILFNISSADLPRGWAEGVRRRLRLPGHRVLPDPTRGMLLDLIRSIEEHGWDNERARRPRCGVLGYSRRARVHHVLSGKHRIATLRYLLSQGRADGATPVEYAVVSYPWGAWGRWRPHPALELCSLCHRAGNPPESSDPAGG